MSLYAHRLAHGGELTITEHDGDYTLHLACRPFTVTCPITDADIWQIRQLTGDLVVQRVKDQAAATEIASEDLPGLIAVVEQAVRGAS